jgi:very-short-patch-repair endonuclease
MREGQKTFTARRLRKDETFAEKRLWEQLRNRTLDGFKFVRQAPIGSYIADFLCRDLNLVVEVDGATHSTNAERARDMARTRHLEELGFHVVRFHNDEVINGMDEVLTLLKQALVGAATPSPPPALCAGSPSCPAGGRGHDKDSQ